MKTEKFFALIALTTFAEANSPIMLPLIAHIWQRHATAVSERTGCNVDAAIAETSLSFISSGINVKGVLITGERNPSLIKNPAIYRQSVIDVVKLVSAELGQLGAQLTFRQVDSEFIEQGTPNDVPVTENAKALALPDPELIAAKVHEAWMQSKTEQGVTSRLSESGEELMVPYEQLSEAAKDLDRGSVMAVLSAIGSLASA